MDPVYTLVLDLDETLIHFVSSNDTDENNLQTPIYQDLEDGENDFFYMVRPFCNKFLKELCPYYEIVIFTAAMQDYADWIIDGIDYLNNVKHRLYRHHCYGEKDGEEPNDDSADEPF